MSRKLTLTGLKSTEVGKALRLSVTIEGEPSSMVTVSLEHTNGAEPLLSIEREKVRLTESGKGLASFTLKFQGKGLATICASARDSDDMVFTPATKKVDVR